ncbi:MAG: uroporphyrinogen-III synthase [Alphaproteobacteria bacterium]
MHVLVTRPEEDAGALVAALVARGHEALVEPMLSVAPAPGVTPPLDLDGVQALLFTSANGVRALAELTARRDLPVFTVGDASAETARAAGFGAVESAGGDVDDLARLVVDRLNPDDGVLYQAAASRRAGDLKGALEAAGFTLRREVLYQTVPASDLSGSLRRELAAGRLAAATFFSPRTAETFAGLVEKSGLSGACAETTALCLSEAVAEKLRGLDWRALRVAERPNQNALLARLDELAGAPSAAPEDDDMTPSQKVIARFGGIRPMAGTLGVAVSTVQGWRTMAESGRRPGPRASRSARATWMGPTWARAPGPRGPRPQARRSPRPRPNRKPRPRSSPSQSPSQNPSRRRSRRRNPARRRWIQQSPRRSDPKPHHRAWGGAG